MPTIGLFRSFLTELGHPSLIEPSQSSRTGRYFSSWLGSAGPWWPRPTGRRDWKALFGRGQGRQTILFGKILLGNRLRVLIRPLRTFPLNTFNIKTFKYPILF